MVADGDAAAPDPLLFPAQDCFEPARTVEPPRGWQVTPLYDPFEAFLGPMFFRTDEAGLELALRIDDRHCVDGLAAPGLMMTFADATLGWAVWRASLPDDTVTISQRSDFLDTVHQGDLIVCSPRLLRKTREIVFVQGLFKADERPVMSASSLWKVIAAR